MRRFLIAAACALMMFGAGAKAQEGWDEISFQYKPSQVKVDGSTDDGDDNSSLDILSLSFGHAFGVSGSVPVYVRPSLGVDYAFKKIGDDEASIKTYWFSVTPMLDFGYLFTIPDSRFEILPYAGLTSRVNLYGRARLESDVLDENLDILDDDDMNGDPLKRFQLGWHAGADLFFSNFIFGLSYGTDFLEMGEDARIHSLYLKLGWRF